MKIIVDIVFSAKMRGDFQFFGKFWKNLKNFTMVSDFFGEFSGVFGAAEKWKNNSGICVYHRAHRGHQDNFFTTRVRKAAQKITLDF